MYAAWLDDFASRDVEAVGFGVVTLQRPAPTASRSSTSWTRRRAGAAADGATSLRRARRRGSGSPSTPTTSCSATAWSAAPDVTEERHTAAGGDDPSVIVLRQGGGLRTGHPGHDGDRGLPLRRRRRPPRQAAGDRRHPRAARGRRRLRAARPRGPVRELVAAGCTRERGAGGPVRQKGAVGSARRRRCVDPQRCGRRRGQVCHSPRPRGRASPAATWLVGTQHRHADRRRPATVVPRGRGRVVVGPDGEAHDLCPRVAIGSRAPGWVRSPPLPGRCQVLASRTGPLRPVAQQRWRAALAGLEVLWVGVRCDPAVADGARAGSGATAWSGWPRSQASAVARGDRLRHRGRHRRRPRRRGGRSRRRDRLRRGRRHTRHLIHRGPDERVAPVLEAAPTSTSARSGVTML